MTLGEKLLKLTAEYQYSLETRSPSLDSYGGDPLGRAPQEIAAEYEATLKQLLTPSAD